MPEDNQAPGGGKGSATPDRRGRRDYSKLQVLKSQEQSHYEEAIKSFNEEIDKVKLAYHLYFIGTNPKPPRDERARLDRKARNSQQNMPTRTMERFRMQSALIRYTHYCELWDRSIQKLEEGEEVPWVPISHHKKEEKKEEAAGDRKDAVPSNGRPETSRALARLKDPMSEAEEVRKIFTSYVAAKKKCGEEGDLPFEKFQAAIARQTLTLIQKSQAVAVQYRVEIVDNKVAIKAKPVKPEEEE